MPTYYDHQVVLKRVPIEGLPQVYELILAHAEWPFDATPAEMEADNREWDQQFAAETSQSFFARIAAKVRAEIAHGATD